MVHGIFQERLNDELRTQTVSQRFIKLHMERKFIAKPNILNGEVAHGMFQFLLQRNDIIALTQRDAEELGKQGNHLPCAFIALALNHPDDGIQGVV